MARPSALGRGPLLEDTDAVDVGADCAAAATCDGALAGAAGGAGWRREARLLTTSLGRITAFSASLPPFPNRDGDDMPLEPTTMRSPPVSSATSTMAVAGSPDEVRRRTSLTPTSLAMRCALSARSSAAAESVMRHLRSSGTSLMSAGDGGCG